MTIEHVIWTSLPNGVDENGRLHLSFCRARLRSKDGSNAAQAQRFPGSVCRTA